MCLWGILGTATDSGSAIEVIVVVVRLLPFRCDFSFPRSIHGPEGEFLSTTPPSRIEKFAGQGFRGWALGRVGLATGVRPLKKYTTFQNPEFCR